MIEFLKSDIGRLRALGIIEGISLLVLFFIAMPLKYGFGMPQAVSVVGMVHGILFLAFALAVLMVVLQRGWKLWLIPVLLVLASLPFGSFWADAKLLGPRQLAAGENDEADSAA